MELNTVKSIKVVASEEGVAATTEKLNTLSAAQTRVGETAGAAAVTQDKASKTVLSATAAYERMVRAIDPVARATASYEKNLLTLNRAMEQGVISENQYEHSLEILRERMFGAAEETNFLAEARERLNKVSETGSALLGGGLVGGVAGMLGITAVMELGREIKETTKDAFELNAASERLGMSTDRLQELSYAAKANNITFEDLSGALDKFNVAIAQAARGTGTLAPILKANGIALKDEHGNIRSTNDLLMQYTDLIKNASSEEDRSLLERLAYGRSGMNLNDIFKDGSAGLKEYADQAHKAGAVMDEDLIKKSAKIDEAFNKTANQIGIYFKEAVLGAIAAVHDLGAAISKLPSIPIGANIPNYGGIGLGPPAGSGAIGSFGMPGLASPSNGGAGDITWLSGDKMAQGTDTSAYDTSWMSGPPKATIIPDTHKTPTSALDSQLDTLKKETAALQAQAGAWGQDAIAVEAAKKEAEALMAIQEKQAGPVSAQQKKAIEDQIALWKQASEELKHLADVQAASNFLAQGAYDAFTQWVTGAQSLSKAMEQLATKIAEAALQAALLGSGPLAGLFGTSAPGGGVLNSLLSGLVGSFGGGKAGGGPLDPGQWYIAGEHGPEPIWGGGAGAFAAGYRQPGGGGGSGGGGGNVNVNVINQTDSKIAVEDHGMSGGQRQIEVLVAAATDRNIASGKHDRAMSARYGISRPTTRYGSS